VEQLQRAADDYHRAKDALDKARPVLAAAIADAARAGVRQAEIVRTSGYTREQVRRICRAAGIEHEEGTDRERTSGER
jgi:predicted transcriptional regulator